MVKPSQIIHHRCSNSYCKGSILKHFKGNVWRCSECGKTQIIKSTLENFGIVTANQLHKVRQKKELEIDDLTKQQFRKLVEQWKKKNL